MQTTMIRIDFPVDLVEQIRQTHPQCPSSIEVMHHENFVDFAPLEEPIWYPKYECLAFAMSFNETALALRVDDLSVCCLDAEFDMYLSANSTIEKYNECVSHFFAGVSYVRDRNSEDPVLLKRVRELINELNGIDPGCAENNTFWGEFVWDITFEMW